jgi:Ca2+-binding RTX toxin-like protein
MRYLYKDLRELHLARLLLAAVLMAVVWGATMADGAFAASKVKLAGDRLTVTGDGADDKVALRVPASRPDWLEVDLGDNGSADFKFKLAKVRQVNAAMGGGSDLVRIDESVPLALSVTVDGGPGADTLLGGSGDELLLGGDGDDVVDPGRGGDTASLGGGEDRLVWNPGDGSDVVEGQAGDDEVAFNGSGAAETIDVSANGQRVRFFRDISNVTMDLDGVERIATNTLGGADTFNLGDLSGTSVNEVETDFAGVPGGTEADAQPDRMTLAGTDGDDAMEVLGDASSAAVVGLPVLVRALHTEASDLLTVNALGGNDSVNASSLPAGGSELVVDGGPGADSLLGGAGRDLLLGGPGADFVDPNHGDDVALLGAEPDVLRWDPGDGSDVVEGQAGADTMRFNGSGASEGIDVSASGERVRFVRDVGGVTMDLDGMERIDSHVLGGADTITVGDLSGTDLVDVDTNLAGVAGSVSGDGLVDRLIVNATGGADSMFVAGSNGTVDLAGLAASVGLSSAEAINDKLIVNGLGGADTLDATGLAPSTIGLMFNE